MFVAAIVVTVRHHLGGGEDEVRVGGGPRAGSGRWSHYQARASRHDALLLPGAPRRAA